MDLSFVDTGECAGVCHHDANVRADAEQVHTQIIRLFAGLEFLPKRDDGAAQIVERILDGLLDARGGVLEACHGALPRRWSLRKAHRLVRVPHRVDTAQRERVRHSWGRPKDHRFLWRWRVLRLCSAEIGFRRDGLSIATRDQVQMSETIHVEPQPEESCRQRGLELQRISQGRGL